MSRCLSLDLEVSVRDRRIRAFAGVRADTGESTIFPAAREGLPAGLAKLDRFAQDAEFLLGHNLIDFDLPLLKAASPSLRLLRLPAVDTLRLNPLAFPRNPYHHLVKHYQDGQLKRGRVNDPELDARLALEVFDNQQKELRGAPTDLLTAWHWLTAADGGTGFDMVFAALRRASKPSEGRGVSGDSGKAGWERLSNARPGSHGGCGPRRLAAGLCAGMAVGIRGQLGHASLGAFSVPGGGTVGAQAARRRLHRPGV